MKARRTSEEESEKTKEDKEKKTKKEKGKKKGISKKETKEEKDENNDKEQEEEDSSHKEERSEVTEEVRSRLQDLTRDYARGGGDLYSDDSSDDDSTTTDEDEDEDLDEFEWAELDQDAVWDNEVDVEETNRIAICNLDWDRIKAADLMVLFSSFCPLGGSVRSVTIYPSEYGKKRMEEEDRSGPLELTGRKKKKGEEEEEKKMNVTESFCVQYSVQFSGPEQKSRSPVASTPSPDHRSLSNSGHFSSSPIRDVTESSPEVESPTRRFSASPPLSPILCRTTHMPSTRQTSLMLRKERKTTVEVTMMEESSDVGAPLQPLGTFPCSSSLYDVEMDSQPSLESHLEETGSQDTGYQTISSLLTSNFSSTNFPQPSPCDPLVESSVSTKHHVPPSSSSSSYSVTRSKEFKS